MFRQMLKILSVIPEAGNILVLDFWKSSPVPLEILFFVHSYRHEWNTYQLKGRSSE
jgi:hypothetical protein